MEKTNASAGTTLEGMLVADSGTDVTAIAILISMAFLVFVSNILVLLVLQKGRGLFDEVMALLLQILALSDLLGGTVASLLTATLLLLEVTPTSRAICRMAPLVNNFMLLQSLYIVCLVSFCRYLSVTHPLFYLGSVTISRVRIAALSVKAYVLLNTCVFLPIQGFPFWDVLDEMCSAQTERLDVLHHRPSESILSWNFTPAVVFVSVSFVLPLCLLTFVNSRLLCIACRISRREKSQHRVVQRNPKSSGSSNSEYPHQEYHSRIGRRHERKGLRGFLTVFLMTASFYVSCLPYVVVVISILTVTATDVRQYLSKYGWMVALMIMISNAWWNAPIYLLTCRTFRKKALEIVTCRKSRAMTAFQGSGPSHVSHVFQLQPQASHQIETTG
ncbi:beta-1 adrenergic receptor-like [Lytechinus variegatus]|uniref:beta-1 adrenergic receptor-like n=1 Tax=Lytechinus variegatus TaxID=7654 RepID=UPI001BB16CBD|nr:beta-1 adrenergic receptor-like [Lytechinus variegatus]